MPSTYLSIQFGTEYGIDEQRPHSDTELLQTRVAKFLKDHYIATAINDKFMAQSIDGQAFVYFGLCPMIVQGKVNLVAGNGFSCASKDKAIDEKLNAFIEEAKLKEKFAKGVYLESAYGDCLYRLRYNPKLSDKPIIDVIEPHKFEVNYAGDRIKSIVIKLVSNEDCQCKLWTQRQWQVI